MQKIITIIALIFCQQLVSQSILDGFAGDPWINIEQQINDHEREDLLSRIMVETELPTELILDPMIRDNYYFIDIDNNGNADIIYEGPYGENVGVMLFQLTDVNVITSDFIPGTVVEIKKLPISGLIEFTTYQKSCCQGIWNYLTTYVAITEPENLNIHKLRQDVYVNGTKPPTLRMNEVRFSITTEQCPLRSKPNEQTTSINGKSNNGEDIISLYPPGSRGMAIGEELLSNGEVWWFVIMENNIKPEQSIMYKDGEPLGTRSMGWLNNKHIKRN